MRDLAVALKNDATSVAVIAAETASTVDALEFYGPAADRIDGRVDTAARAAGRLSERLLAVVALLNRSASDVEAQQHERELQLERLRAERAPGLAR